MLYRFIRFIYSILFVSIIPCIFIKKIVNGYYNQSYNERWFERFGKVSFRLKRSILIHSVSIGESIAVAPLVKKLSITYPDLEIVVTTMTLTGSTQVKKIYQDYSSIHHTYLPYDIPIFLNNFFKYTNPEVCIIMETELWPNLLAICHKKLIPVIITNARLSAKSVDLYKKIRFFTRNMFSHISHVNAQTNDDKKRFVSLGMQSKKIVVTGNIKYDFSVDPGIVNQASLLKARFGKRPIWIASSTHHNEEEIILQAHQKIQIKYPTALFIIVPRHPERFNKVYRIIKRYRFRISRRSWKSKKLDAIDVYLADTMGEMMLFYAVSDIVFVGGSFSGTGGHNMIEPSALSKVIITGPSTFNFSEVIKFLLRNKALIITENAQELADNIVRLFQEKREHTMMGRRAFSCYNQNRGALNTQFRFIRQLVDEKKMAIH